MFARCINPCAVIAIRRPAVETPPKVTELPLELRRCIAPRCVQGQFPTVREVVTPFFERINLAAKTRVVTGLEMDMRAAPPQTAIAVGDTLGVLAGVRLKCPPVFVCGVGVIPLERQVSSGANILPVKSTLAGMAT